MVVEIIRRGVRVFHPAVIAIKSPDRDLNKARTALHTILEENHLQMPRERLAILLKHGESMEDSFRITMSRESDPLEER